MKLREALEEAAKQGKKLKRAGWTDWHWQANGELRTDTIGGEEISTLKGKYLTIEDCFAEDWEIGLREREFWLIRYPVSAGRMAEVRTEEPTTGNTLGKKVVAPLICPPTNGRGQLWDEYREIVHVREVL